ncbi:uncharacterized protein FOMMEDRAFT_27907 [Fomitiporia mediterranea MF3/22]|uniref:uncharacterized protein n=1 Tax=Fomitiporia mediterranea (strain MF3/22) TaxID=694068 RepID=UPI0004409740|nr:uncharacterized protein FOMMEDRAFT_27907 [Fomitiporia mediterranea MF3/22]EJD04124.1 hypothetical protein FOMMEDRAFT_27907 [Fomitiporia mediterranea MF3/22]
MVCRVCRTSSRVLCLKSKDYNWLEEACHTLIVQQRNTQTELEAQYCQNQELTQMKMKLQSELTNLQDKVEHEKLLKQNEIEWAKALNGNTFTCKALEDLETAHILSWVDNILRRSFKKSVTVIQLILLNCCFEAYDNLHCKLSLWNSVMVRVLSELQSQCESMSQLHEEDYLSECSTKTEILKADMFIRGSDSQERWLNPTIRPRWQAETCTQGCLQKKEKASSDSFNLSHYNELKLDIPLLRVRRTLRKKGKITIVIILRRLMRNKVKSNNRENLLPDEVLELLKKTIDHTKKVYGELATVEAEIQGVNLSAEECRLGEKMKLDGKHTGLDLLEGKQKVLELN